MQFFKYLTRRQAFLASSFVLLLVSERRNKAKHVQFVSGADALSYWVSAYVWDFCNYLIPFIGIAILFAIFQFVTFSLRSQCHVI